MLILLVQAQFQNFRKICTKLTTKPLISCFFKEWNRQNNQGTFKSLLMWKKIRKSLRYLKSPDSASK